MGGIKILNPDIAGLNEQIYISLKFKSLCVQLKEDRDRGKGCDSKENGAIGSCWCSWSQSKQAGISRGMQIALEAENNCVFTDNRVTRTLILQLQETAFGNGFFQSLHETVEIINRFICSCGHAIS